MKSAQEKRTQIRRRIIFYGRVQGVGFRYRAKYHALDLGLTGWVENGWDGTVTMEVQGGADEINTLILRMQRERFVEIERYQATVAALQEERRFHIR